MAILSGGGTDLRCDVPIRSGTSYRVTPLPRRAWVTPDLRAELERVFERFAREAGFTSSNPVLIELRPGIFGHHQVARAVDIYGVAGKGMEQWKTEWDRLAQAALNAPDARARRLLFNRRRMRNLGWRLYKALQIYGRWAQPYGYPIQLFGPWTRVEGPWKHISDTLLFAHRDHIHVAR